MKAKDTSQLTGYDRVEVLYTGRMSSVVSARRSDDGHRVVLKIANSPHMGAAETARMRHEYSIMVAIESPHVARPSDLTTIDGRIAIVFDDRGDRSLASFPEVFSLSARTKLQIAIELATALSHIHRQGIIHKDINPANILIHPQKLSVRVVDFNIATQRVTTRSGERPLGRLEGTLAYISPEQTGRFERAIDGRSDLYSLGATLYWLFVGSEPFKAEDAIGLIHQHLAKVPVAPKVAEGSIPLPISEIILRLLAKDSADRYQSAESLTSDLRRVAECLDTAKDLPRLGEGWAHIPAEIAPPGWLIGRQNQVDTITEIAAKAGRGARQVVSVSGDPGIGKTALLVELRNRLPQAIFGVGRYHELLRTIPYKGLIEALLSLCRQQMAQRQSSVERWKQQVEERLGDAIQVLSDLDGEFAEWFGARQAPPTLGAQEAKNRLAHVVRTFLSTIAPKDQPVVLCLDDAQWIDLASGDLLGDVLGDSSLGNIALILSQRKIPTDTGHPLQHLLGKLNAHGAELAQIEVTGLTSQATAEFVAAVLGRSAREVDEMAAVVWSRTSGNPYFILEYLRTLQRDGILGIERDGPSPGWVWQLEQIRAQAPAENVVDLVVSRLRAAPEHCRRLLSVASCLGGRFTVKDLAQIPSTDLGQLGRSILDCIAGQFLRSSSDVLDVLPYLSAEDDWLTGAVGGCEVSFVHDRVRVAAGSLLSPAEAEAIHLGIGRQLLQRLDAKSGLDSLFVAAQHLNRAASGLLDEKERLAVAELNARVGHAARDSAAFHAALEYFRAGVAQLGSRAFITDHTLAMRLHLGLLEAAQLTRHQEEYRFVVKTIDAHASDPLDRVRMLTISMQAACSQREFESAVSLGIEALSLLGVKLPEKPGVPRILLGFARAEKALKQRSLSTLPELPRMSDEKALMSMRILMDMTSAAYFVRPNLFPLIVFEMVALTMSQGLCAESCYAFAVHGVLRCAAFGKVQSGFDLGKCGLSLVAPLGATKLEGKIILAFHASVHHWREPLRDCLALFATGFMAARDVGDFEYAALSSVGYCNYSYLAGTDLGTLADRYASYQEAVERLREASHLPLLKVFRQAIVCLMEQDPGVASLAGSIWNDVVDGARLDEARDLTTACVRDTIEMHLAYLCHDAERAVMMGERASRNVKAILGTAYVPMYVFFRALSLLRYAAAVDGHRRARAIWQAKRLSGRMTKFARSAPKNYEHKAKLILAELESLQGDATQASKLYEEAASGASRNEFLQDEALAFELHGEHMRKTGIIRVAGTYFREAATCYRRWGALRLAMRLEAREHATLSTAIGTSQKEGPGLVNNGGTVTTRTVEKPAFDAATIAKAARAIFSEHSQGRLFASLTPIILESSGAQRALVLLLDGSEHYEIAIIGDVNGARAAASPGDRAEGHGLLSDTVVSLVRNSRRPVIVHDAKADDSLIRDEYVRRSSVRSILCFPLLRAEALIGMIYLENNAASHAFSTSQIDVVSLIASQVAISIDNVRLYEDMGARVETRTRELSRALTELKATQAELVEAGKLAALGSMVAAVAHEVNTPLGIGITLSSTLRHETERLKESLATGLKRSDLEKYMDSAGRALGMLQRNLSIVASQVDQFKSVSVRRDDELRVDFAVAEVARAAIDSLRVQENLKNLQVAVEGADDVVITGYPGAFMQIVYNLVKNAVHHAFAADGAGSIAITVRNADDDQVEFTFKDDGRGIDADRMLKLFSPFNTTSRSRGNMGLGLHIVHNIVHQKFGGRIECKSVIDAGTTFTILLPKHGRTDDKKAA